ncbi:MAG TPA: hypothetical protein PKX38_09530 [Alphaproteobacteria bacterium]|nr:hypothetical protein [Alphaproteobacteria bacterium]
MKENDVQKVYWAAYEDGEVMESDDGILLISFDKETVEHYPSLPNQVLQVMICRPTASRPDDAALKSPPECEIEGLDEAFRALPNYRKYFRFDSGMEAIIEAARRYAALTSQEDSDAEV